MYLHLLLRSLTERKSRTAIPFVAVMVGAALVTALVGVSLDMTEKMTRELRAYGANLAIVPDSGETQPSTGAVQEDLPDRLLAAFHRLDQRGALVGYVPYLYGVVQVNGVTVALAGTRFDQARRVYPYWGVTGRWGRDTDADAMVGTNAARRLGLRPGDRFIAEAGDEGRSQEFQVAGVVATGASEDEQMFVPLRFAQPLLNRPERISLVAASVIGGNDRVLAVGRDIVAQTPAARAQPIRRVAASEGRLLRRITVLVGVVTSVTLVAVLLCVMTTMTAAVVERQREIGLLKAMGAENRSISLLLLGEVGTIGLGGGLAGCGLGLLLCQAIEQSAFGSSLTIRPLVFPAVIGLAVGLSVLAGLIPVRRATAIDPAVILRGE
ncbi:MAG: FtsX-like permease family protein [Candidatus Latescibacteria bacterium]|nr:FtsX-like permease family protein [Candidatus Latescibacterota bacterium]